MDIHGVILKIQPGDLSYHPLSQEDAHHRGHRIKRRVSAVQDDPSRPKLLDAPSSIIYIRLPPHDLQPCFLTEQAFDPLAKPNNGWPERMKTRLIVLASF